MDYVHELHDCFLQWIAILSKIGRFCSSRRENAPVLVIGYNCLQKERIVKQAKYPISRVAVLFSTYGRLSPDEGPISTTIVPGPCRILRYMRLGVKTESAR